MRRGISKRIGRLYKRARERGRGEGGRDEHGLRTPIRPPVGTGIRAKRLEETRLFHGDAERDVRLPVDVLVEQHAAVTSVAAGPDGVIESPSRPDSVIGCRVIDRQVIEIFLTGIIIGARVVLCKDLVAGIERLGFTSCRGKHHGEKDDECRHLRARHMRRT